MMIDERVCGTADVAINTMKSIIVKDTNILIANIDGKFYAMDAICSHQQGRLSEGKLNGHIVTCPVHKAQYDIRTGKVEKQPSGLIRKATHDATDLRIYPLKVDNGSIIASI
jgi:3-phenylpropionate/trans-cinnamate dioxygenase ferredoxin subunit